MGEPIKTYCRICEAACGLEVELLGASTSGRTSGELKIRPDREHPVSRGFVCAKGTRFAEVAFHPARLLAPCVREGGALRETSWKEALETAGRKIAPVLERYGPNAVGIYVGNPLAFHAMGQAAALFFGKALGTRNIFTAGSQDCSNKFAAASILHGSPAIHPIPDFEHAELAVLFGTNPAVSQASFVHLEGGASIFDRMKDRGARIVWVDVRRTESAERWGELVTIRPGTDVWLLLALVGLFADRASGDPNVEGLDALLELAREITPARAAAVTGIEERTIRELADAIRAANGAALHMSVGVNQGPFGTLSYVALQALQYLSGNYDRRGGSLFSPLGVGAAHVTRALGIFTRTETSRVGDFPAVFDALPGAILADEITTPGDERIRALIVIAGDPLRSIPGAKRLEAALSSLDALVTIDLFESQTGRHADVILPVTSWLERADVALPGLPLQTVDLLQTTRRVMEPIGDTRSDHAVIADLSVAIGRPLFGSVMLSKLIARADTDRIIERASDLAWRLFDRRPERRGHGVPVPTPQPDSYLGRGPLTPGHRVRFWDPRLTPERARMIEHERAIAQANGFVLLGRRRRIGHNSWLHGGTREGALEGEAWLAKDDMIRLGIDDGATIELTTSASSARLPARAHEGIAIGTIVVPHGELEVNVNELIPAGPEHVEPLSGMCLMTGVPVDVRSC
jgi:anaerobic selenocysteine-containing dehydrogenase